jgi:hypothetical protein
MPAGRSRYARERSGAAEKAYAQLAVARPKPGCRPSPMSWPGGLYLSDGCAIGCICDGRRSLPASPYPERVRILTGEMRARIAAGFVVFLELLF